MDNPSQLLSSEFKKLEKIIENIDSSAEKTIPDIVNLYYQMIMVQTLAKKIKSDISENHDLSGKIDKIQAYISERFSKSLHPEILLQLTNSIQSSTENLKLLDQNSEKKTKETIEKEALLYKELRELMSTKEFVELYEIGIKND